jgi:hypothetical protein
MTRIYISSTYSDLKEHREAAARALRRMNKTGVAMEDYVATDERPLDKCLADVASCDAYVGIFAWRYGYVPDKDNPGRKSITELEYRKAAELGKPRLIFLLDPQASWPPPAMDAVTGEGERGARINAMRAELLKERHDSFFSSPDQLAGLVSAAVANWEEQQRGPAASDSSARTATVTPQPREISRHLYLVYSGLDEAFARHLAEQLQPHGRSLILSPRALFAERPEDFQELESSVSQCHAAAVVLSDAALNQLDEQRDRTRHILSILQSRTGLIIGLCRSAASLQRAHDMGLAQSLDLSLWQPGIEPPIDLVMQVERAIALCCPTVQTRTVGLPFVVVAMTEDEAQELDQKPELIQHGLGDAALEHFTRLKQALGSFGAPPFVQRYAPAREYWRPFGVGQPTVQALIGDTVAQLNNAHQPRLLGRSIKIQHYPFGELIDQVQVLRPIYREIAQNGCVVVVDELSLFHPRVRNTFLGSALFASDHVAMVTIAPLDPYAVPPHNLLEQELSERLAAVFDRFALDYDPQCEFSIGDERRLKRWLHSSLPQALQTLREPRPNRQMLDNFAAELGKKRDLAVAKQLYADGGVL